jgi:hypothetical protein
VEGSPSKRWVIGLLKTLKTIRVPKWLVKVAVHGLLIVVTLTIIQAVLDAYQIRFMLFLPPIGFAFFLAISYVIQPVIVGVVNVVALNSLYKTEGCQIGFWLNGFFLFLVFSSINLLLQTVYGVAFTWQVAVVEAVVFSIPFGYLGRFSNTGLKTPKNSYSDERNGKR